MKFLKAASLILFIQGFIQGCAQSPIVQDSALLALWQTHHQQMTQSQIWQVNGSIVIASAQDTWNARVYWQQQVDSYQLRFNAPLGQGAMLLFGNPQQVTMQTTNQESFTAQDPDALVKQVLKVEIPVSHLYYWIRGIPNPNIPIHSYTLNNQGYLHTLTQANWVLEFQNYQASPPLPQKFYLYNGEFDVKMSISYWQLGQT